MTNVETKEDIDRARVSADETVNPIADTWTRGWIRTLWAWLTGRL